MAGQWPRRGGPRPNPGAAGRGRTLAPAGPGPPHTSSRRCQPLPTMKADLAILAILALAAIAAADKAREGGG